MTTSQSGAASPPGAGPRNDNGEQRLDDRSPANEVVAEADEESFRASDAPGWILQTTIGPPARGSAADLGCVPGYPAGGLSAEDRCWRGDDSRCRPIPSRHDQNAHMNTDPTRIVVTETRCRMCGVPIFQIYHQAFAVMRVEAASTEEAAGSLVNRLGAAVGDAADPLIREEVRSALADARAFLDGARYANPGRDVPYS
jgi:hypothetical protein